MDTVIEVKGSKSNVTVSWDKKDEEGEANDVEMKTNAGGQMKDSGKDVYKDPKLLLHHISFRKGRCNILCFEY